MASGTGNSSVINPVPVGTPSSLLHNYHPIGFPNSMGGNTASYASKGGYIPGIKTTNTRKGTKRGGGSKKKRARKSRRSTMSKASKK
uniref:Uncharacterized protein n=1 Tax=viral metagenome TaxID=1070528 RepID=A0A6C0IBD7_9ZZZZ